MTIYRTLRFSPNGVTVDGHDWKIEKENILRYITICKCEDCGETDISWSKTKITS